MKVGISSVEGEVPAFLFESNFQSVETKSFYYHCYAFSTLPESVSICHFLQNMVVFCNPVD
jgi:hypothetical protein